MDRMNRCLDALEAEADTLDHPHRLDAIATACACSYADFRYPELDWRANRPTLAALYEGYNARPSMQATQLTDQSVLASMKPYVCT